MKHLKLILGLGISDFKARYAGTVLGGLWAFALPVVTVLLYLFVYSVMGVQTVSGYPYVLYLICGAVPWFFMADAWTGMTGVYRHYAYLIKKVQFPREVLPAVRLTAALPVHLFFTLLAFFIAWQMGCPPGLHSLWLFYFLLCNAVFAYGVGALLAILCGAVKDVAQILTVILQLGFWLLPIFWNGEGLSGGVRTLIYLNPLCYLVEGYRTAILGGRISGAYTLYFWGFTLAVLLLQRWLSRRLLPRLPDIL